MNYSQSLIKARKYEEENGERVDPILRPLYHLTPYIGWMNDPNGFSWYNGYYHLFYQYYPFAKKWGPMHWGHAVSKDLLHWEFKPAALAPDTVPDEDGCFSGSAIELNDGRHLLLYTGVTEVSTDEYQRTLYSQIQCVAVGDGENYEKYDGNPVIDQTMIPSDTNSYDFRDPKIWKEADGTYRCVVANGVDKDFTHGRVLYFSSEDGFHWKYVSTLLENDGSMGKMWECPDFFELDGTYVMLMSPQDVLQTPRFNCGNQTICILGDFDEEAGKMIPKADMTVDYGIDFYATQTMLTPDGRRVMIAWMQNWDTIKYTEQSIPWLGMMTLPRELSIVNERLIQKPIREIEELRTHEVVYKHVVVGETLVLDAIRGRSLDLTIELYPESFGSYTKFEMRFAVDEHHYTSIVYRPRENRLEFDRSNSGTRVAVMHDRHFFVRNRNGQLKLRLLLDRYSSEVFINDGEQVMTNVLYTPLSADNIWFYCDGKVLMDVEKYELMDPAQKR
ncbi:MAG: glycoside hydrolase family 32 protein [Solobacterium sp.]|nr:glycoside hydrolase family 32 protein [Solobacterium sp.]